MKKQIETMVKSHLKTSIGWDKKSFPTDVAGLEVQIGGIFSLIPRDSLRFVTICDAEAKFDRDNFIQVINEQLKLDWVPFIWKDAGIKDASGTRRMYPFVKRGFAIVNWLKDELGYDFSKVFTISKMVKIAKYLSQPVDFSRCVTARVLVIPSDLLNADGCGYSRETLFNGSGMVVKVLGMGNGVIYKGTIIQDIDLDVIIPDNVRKEITKHNVEYDVVATTDTVKFSIPWTVYDIDLFWHNDSSRNIHETVTVSEQLMRVAHTTGEFQEWTMARLNERHVIIKDAMNARGKAMGSFVKNAAMDQDFAPNDGGMNAIVGDVGDLLSVGIPFAFRNIQKNVMKAIQSFVRNRTISCMKVPGTFSFVIANQTLARGEIIIPIHARDIMFDVFGREIDAGDKITLFRSPISPTSVHEYEVVGFADDYHVQMRSEDLNEFHQGDMDGDKVGVVILPFKVITENRDRLDDPEIQSWIESFETIKKTVTEPLPEGNAIVQMVNEIELVVLSGAIGFAERARAAIESMHGDRSWKMAYAFFQVVEQGLIDMKKHSGIRWDPMEMINGMIGKLIPVRRNYHKLLANRRNSLDALAKFLRKPELDKCEHEFKDVYVKGVAMARCLIDGLAVTHRDIVDLANFKTDMATWLNHLIDGSSDKAVIRKHVIGIDMKPKGGLQAMRVSMAKFYGTLSGAVNRAETKSAFHDSEKARFDNVSADIRKAIIGTILYNEVYAWLLHFELKEVRAIINEATGGGV